MQVVWQRVNRLAVALLAVHALLLALSVPRNAVTIDEVVHLPTGIANWQRGEFWGYHHNPPLIRLLFAIPPVIADVPIDFSAYTYRTHPRGVDCDLGRSFMLLNRDHYLRVFWMSRGVVAGLTVLGGWFVFRWSRELFGDAGGLVSLALWVFSPEVLAHGGLVTTDMGATVMGLIATYYFWRHLQGPSLGRAVCCGVLLGLTEASKFTFILLPAAWGAMAGVKLWSARRARTCGPLTPDRSPPKAGAKGEDVGRTGSPSLGDVGAPPEPYPHSLVDVKNGRIGNPSYEYKWRTACGHALVVCGISLLVLNDVYLGEGTGRRLGEFEFRSRTLTREVARRPLTPGPSPPQGGEGREWTRRENRFRGTWLANVPVPLPNHYVLGFDDQMYDVDTGMFDKYLHGDLRRGRGWWYYFLYAMLVKTPVGALVLMVGGLAAVALRRCRVDIVSEAALLLPIVVFFVAISSQTGLQYLRYMLPVYPFLFVCAGRPGRILDFRFWMGGRAEGAGRIANPSVRRGTEGRIGNPSYRGGREVEGGASFRGAKGDNHGRIGNPSYGGLVARRGGALVVALLIAWNIVSVLRVHPHYLAYFNEPAGGPRNGLAHLANSNIDWGQGLIALKEWLDEHAPGEKIRLAYFGTMYPEVLGIDYELPPFAPEALPAERDPLEAGPVPGLQAVSANFLVGVPFPAPNAEGRQTSVPLRAYSYYQRFEPIATPGWSIYVYDLGVDEVNGVRREMGLAEL